MKTTPMLFTIGLVVAVLSTACTKKEWKCTACVSGSTAECADSSRYVQNRTEAEAQCSAGEELCSSLISNGATFDRICRGKSTTRMLGCSEAFLGQLTFQCAADTQLNAPLPGVR